MERNIFSRRMKENLLKWGKRKTWKIENNIFVAFALLLYLFSDFNSSPHQTYSKRKIELNALIAVVIKWLSRRSFTEISFTLLPLFVFFNICWHKTFYRLNGVFASFRRKMRNGVAVNCCLLLLLLLAFILTQCHCRIYMFAVVASLCMNLSRKFHFFLLIQTLIILSLFTNVNLCVKKVFVLRTRPVSLVCWSEQSVYGKRVTWRRCAMMTKFILIILNVFEVSFAFRKSVAEERKTSTNFQFFKQKFAHICCSW